MILSSYALIGWLLIAQIDCTDITNQVFGTNVNAIPAAFGDFNSDELTDLFVIKGKSVDVLLSTSEGEPMLQSSNITCKFECSVTSLVPGDFNGDAFMDVLVTTQCAKEDLLNVFILWGHQNNINCTAKDLFKTKGEPMALDYNDDFITDLFGEDEHGERTFWIFSQDKSFKKISLVSGCYRDLRPGAIRRPHSNAFLDLNNDCIADMFITGGKTDHDGFFEVSLI